MEVTQFYISEQEIRIVTSLYMFLTFYNIDTYTLTVTYMHVVIPVPSNNPP